MASRAQTCISTLQTCPRPQAARGNTLQPTDSARAGGGPATRSCMGQHVYNSTSNITALKSLARACVNPVSLISLARVTLHSTNMNIDVHRNARRSRCLSPTSTTAGAFLFGSISFSLAPFHAGSSCDTRHVILHVAIDARIIRVVVEHARHQAGEVLVVGVRGGPPALAR